MPLLAVLAGATPPPAVGSTIFVTLARDNIQLFDERLGRRPA